MLFSLNFLKEHIQGQLPAPEKLDELLNMHIFEVEGKEKKGKDWIFDIDILSQRGDAASHRGLARELAALLQRQMTTLSAKTLKKEKGSLAPLNVKVKSPFVRRYSALVLEGIQITPSPQWLQDRLKFLGINPINNIVDITNYIMIELGQPLHAFDYDAIKNHQMIVREAKEGESIDTLDDLTFKLPKGALVIEDKGRLIDLAGIKGGKYSSIQQNTKNVVLQAASFSGKHIYKTKKQLGYTTEAADLYSRGLDPNATLMALERAVELLSKQGKVKIVQVIDIYPKEEIAKKILFDPASLERYLGASIPKIVAIQILKRLGFIVKEKNNTWEIIIPTFRQDINVPIDIIEEIARMYGYEKINPIFPIGSILPSIEDPIVRFQEQLQDTLVKAGFSEIYSYSFIGEKDLQTFRYTPKDVKALVELENPYSAEYKYLRTNLLENLLKVVGENTKRYLSKNIYLFELGKVFENTKQKIAERNLITGVLHIPKKDDQVAFAQAKGVIDFLLSRLGIADSWYDNYHQTPLYSRASLWHDDKIAEIKVEQKKIGFLGIVEPSIASNLKLNGSVAAFVLDVQELLHLIAKEYEYRPIPRFPAVLRDLAVLVPRTTKVIDVMNIIHAKGAKLIDNIDLFDMYEGEHIPGGQKSLAFHLIYQAKDKTLTTKEADSAHQKIISALEKNPAWEVRK
ncbi:phenylalanine--tRNA ligase subunit beta [Patescibacteria group bacterium]|nr:phenylalanine--tRNA ligase subunit beta [Patescibacteria group bacterium]